MTTEVTASGFSEDDVVSGRIDELGVSGLNRVQTLIDKASQQVGSNYRKLRDEGVYCQLLRTTGGGWKEGKLRLHINVTIEFVPDEPDEPPPGALVKG